MCCWPTTRSVSSTSTRPRSSTGRPSALDDRVGGDAGRPHHGLGRDAAPVGEPDALGVDGGQPRPGDDLDAAPVQRALGEAREAVGRLAEDPRACVDQHPAGPDVSQARVAAQRLLGHLGDLGDRLDAREAGAGDDEGQPPLGGVRRGVGQLDLAQDVVAQADRVAEVLEPERVLAQPGHGRDAGDRSEGDHELLVGDRDAARLGLHLDHAALGIVRDGAAQHEIGVGAHRAQRHGDVAGLDVARRRLGQQRRVEHEVGRVDDRGAAAAEPAGDVGAGEAAAEHEHAAPGDAPAEGLEGDGRGSRLEGGVHGGQATAGRPGSNRATP